MITGRKWLIFSLICVIALMGGAIGNVQAEGTDEELAQPISDYFILDEVLADDPVTGEQLLYAATYVAGQEGVYFVAIDPVKGDVRKQLYMPGTYGGYHLDAAPDGRVYMATMGSGQADMWMYDPTAGTVSIVASAPNPGGQYQFAFGVTVSQDNKVYMSVVPAGKVYKYDPADGMLTDLGVLADGGYAKALVSLPGNRLLVGSGSPAQLTVLNLVDGTKTEILPAEYSQYSFAYNAALVDNDIFVSMVSPDNRLLRFDAATLQFEGEAPGVPGSWGMPVFGLGDGQYYLFGSNQQTGLSGIWRHNLLTDELSWQTAGGWNGIRMYNIEIDGESWITSVGTKGLWGRWNPTTGEVITRQLPLPGSPTNITALRTGPDGKIYGGTYETNALFSWDPTNDRLEILGPVSGTGGEILSMANTNGKLFIGSYTGAILTVYDPTLPWNPGSSPGSNPYMAGTMGEQQYRPWDMIVGSDGRVFAATSAAYGFYGGALTAIDPDTYEMESWRYLAGEQQLFSLAPGDGEIYVGTTKYGDATVADGDAKLLVFDMSTKRVVFGTVPLPGSGRMTALATAADGRVYGAGDNGRWFVFDPETRSVQQLGHFPLGTVLGFTKHPDGTVYGHTSSHVFRLNTADNSAEAVSSSGASYWRTLDFDHTGRIYWAKGPSLMRHTPETPDLPPTAVVTYSATGWTNQDVVATIVPSEPVTVTNNNGSLSHTFTANGSFTFEFVDAAGQIGTATATVANIDKEAPTLTVTVDRPVLGPPNHKMVPVQVTLQYSDGGGSGIDSFKLVSVTSNEPDNGEGDGNTVNDIQGADIGTPDTSLLLRAERSGQGSGRVYTITYSVSDRAGNTTTASAYVTVPH